MTVMERPTHANTNTEANPVIIEFVDGPKDGTVLQGHGEFPRFMLVNGRYEIVPWSDTRVGVYMLAEDGKYHYLVLE